MLPSRPFEIQEYSEKGMQEYSVFDLPRSIGD